MKQISNEVFERLEKLLHEALSPKVDYNLNDYFQDDSGNFEKELQFNAIVNSQVSIQKAITIINQLK
jgi:hypothetical protein